MRCLGKRIEFNACDVSKSLNDVHSSLSVFSQSYFLCTPLKILLEYSRYGWITDKYSFGGKQHGGEN